MSTNDVLASRFFNAAGSRAGLMPINFRGKHATYVDEDAGNYEGSLTFDAHDFADPSLIRKTLQTGNPGYLRLGAGEGAAPKPLPGCCASMSMRLGMHTSWVFPHFDELRIEGCQHLLHQPHTDVTMVRLNLYHFVDIDGIPEEIHVFMYSCIHLSSPELTLHGLI